MRFPIGNGIPWTGATKTLFDGTTAFAPDGIVRFITLYGRCISAAGASTAMSVSLTTPAGTSTIASVTPADNAPQVEYTLLDRVPVSGAVTLTATAGDRSVLYGFLEYDAVDAPLAVSPFYANGNISSLFVLTTDPEDINRLVDDSILQYVTLNISTDINGQISLNISQTQNTTNLLVLDFDNSATSENFRLFDNIPMLGANMYANGSGLDEVIYGFRSITR
jgi:hypothetical protein